MTSLDYAHVSRPWSAAISVAAPEPARFYVSIIGQALRYGLPARRRFGAAWAFAGRNGIPERPLAAAVRRLPRRARPDLDELVEMTLAAWDDLTARAAGDLPRPAAPGVLELQRSAGRTVFVFGDAPRPLVVLRESTAARGAEVREAAALREAEPAAIAPRHLGRVGAAEAQEGLQGTPLVVGPMTPDRASALTWTPRLAALSDALERLAATTAKPGFAEQLRRPTERALADGKLAPAARRALEAAWRDVQRVDASVLRHHDTSPQNCLFSGDHLDGIVDWEWAEPQGAPGFDLWNAALSYTEYGIGLVRWSQEIVLDVFERAWRDSSFWQTARADGRRTAAAAGVPEHALDSLEVVFFGSRVGDRLNRKIADYPTTDVTAARMLEIASA